jgi:hypothetical protein
MFPSTQCGRGTSSDHTQGRRIDGEPNEGQGQVQPVVWERSDRRGSDMAFVLLLNIVAPVGVIGFTKLRFRTSTFWTTMLEPLIPSIDIYIYMYIYVNAHLLFIFIIKY